VSNTLILCNLLVKVRPSALGGNREHIRKLLTCRLRVDKHIVLDRLPRKTLVSPLIGYTIDFTGGLMDEADYRRREMRLKWINTVLAAFGGIGVVASIWFGLARLRHEWERQSRAIREQWRQTFYDERIAVYSRATETAGRIASLMSSGGTDEELSEAVVEFRTLFWGPMCITEGADVEKAMVKFNKGLNSNLSAAEMEQLALYLAHVCRNEAYNYYFEDKKAGSRYGPNEEVLSRMDAVISGQAVDG